MPSSWLTTLTSKLLRARDAVVADRLRGLLPPALLVAVFAVTYAKTLLPGIHEFGDVTKAQFVGRLMGTTHPTGYPLYNLASGAFSWIPLGTLAQRANAFSAVCAITTLVFVLNIQRSLGVKTWLAFASTCLFGWSKTFWSQSVIAEVYTLNSCLVAATLYCLVRWHQTKSERWFIGACGIYAISFGNHLTVVTLLPAFAFATFAGHRKVLGNVWVVVAVAFVILLGISLYYYPIWRTKAGSLYLEFAIDDLPELVDYVTGSTYRRKMFAFSTEQLLFERLPRFTGQLAAELGPLAALLPVGLVASRQRWLSGVLTLGLLGELLWVLGYDIPDIDIYIIPVVLISTIAIGVALSALYESSKGMAVIVLLALVPSVVVLPWFNWEKMGHAKAERFDRRVNDTLQALGQRAVVVGRVQYSERMGLVYHLYAEGLSEERQLHLAHNATLAQVRRYLERRGTLKDAHTRQLLPAGLRVFISERAEKEGWARGGNVQLGERRSGLREVTLRER